MMIRDSMMRGTSATVLRKLVKKFGLSKFDYPINTSTSKLVLLISDHPDLTATEATEKKEEQVGVKKFSVCRLKSAIKIKRKEKGPYIRTRHQYGVEPNASTGCL